MLAYYQYRSKPTNRLTDKQEIYKYLEIVCKHSRNVSNIFQEDISDRTEDMPTFV